LIEILQAPLNGYAFGKGVYLADISSKSANYCISSMSGGIGLLLLCEAECSDPMYEIPTGDSEAEDKCKKKNCIATKGIGKIVPQNWKDAGAVHDSLKGVLMVSDGMHENLSTSTNRL
jgi:poly [ADP-ribose] polymerase